MPVAAPIVVEDSIVDTEVLDANDPDLCVIHAHPPQVIPRCCGQENDVSRVHSAHQTSFCVCGIGNLELVGVLRLEQDIDPITGEAVSDHEHSHFTCAREFPVVLTNTIIVSSVHVPLDAGLRNVQLGHVLQYTRLEIYVEGSAGGHHEHAGADGQQQSGSHPVLVSERLFDQVVGGCRADEEHHEDGDHVRPPQLGSEHVARVRDQELVPHVESV